MNVATALITEVIELPGPLFMVCFDCPELTRLAQPGQFVMVQCGEGLDPFLARPFSLGRARPTGVKPLEYSLLINVVGRGSEWLARRRIGDLIELCGPLGNPIGLQRETRNLLLVAHGVHFASLLLLADEAIQRGISVTLVHELPPGGEPYPAMLLPPEVELAVVEGDSDDWAQGRALPGYLRWADQIVVAGGESLLRRLATELRSMQLSRPVQAVVWTPLPCGTGTCAGCPIQTLRHGLRLVCRDGPRFDLQDLW